MIVHDVVQGSPEWMALRVGIPTASQFNRIFQPVRRKPSMQRDVFLLELVDEWINKKREEPFENEWTRRGRELEAEARFGYAMEQNVAVRQVGFVSRDDGLVGGSPDGLVGDDIVLEVKCKSPQIHLALFDGTEPGHIAQCQGLMYICERPLAHLWCYSDTGDSILKVIERDQDYIDSFVPVLDAFLADLEAAKAEVSLAYRSAS